LTKIDTFNDVIIKIGLKVKKKVTGNQFWGEILEKFISDPGRHN